MTARPTRRRLADRFSEAVRPLPRFSALCGHWWGWLLDTALRRKSLAPAAEWQPDQSYSGHLAIRVALDNMLWPVLLIGPTFTLGGDRRIFVRDFVESEPYSESCSRLLHFFAVPTRPVQCALPKKRGSDIGFPLASPDARAGGWTLDPTWLSEISVTAKSFFEDGSSDEEVEAIALAIAAWANSPRGVP